MIDLSPVDAVEFLTGLDVANISCDDREVSFSCPFPGHRFGDINPSASMNRETTAWICFGCGAKGSAVTMLAGLKNVSRVQATRWIAERWLPDQAYIDDLESYMTQLLHEGEGEGPRADTGLASIPSCEVARCKVDWPQMDDLDDPPPWARYLLDERGFTPKALGDFGMGYDAISDRLALLARDQQGIPVGLKGRAWKGDAGPKYLVLGDTPKSLERYGKRYGFAPYDVSDVVYGLDIAEPCESGLNVCEGELNVIAMRQKGFPCSVGVSGSTFSRKQRDQIIARCDHVTLVMDSDLEDEGKANVAMMKLMAAIDVFDPYVSVSVVPPHDRDPADMTREQLQALMEAATPASLFRLSPLAALL